MKILLVDNYDSFTYNLVHRLREIGVHDLVVVRNDKVDLSSLHEFSHIVLSPGPGLPRESGQMMEVIDSVRSTSATRAIRLLGVCLGHQAIAESFGASLRNLQEVVHGKEHEIAVDTECLLFRGLPKQIRVGRYHSWVVDRNTLPAELLEVGTSKDSEIMAMAHKEYPIFGVQFHPESVMTETGQVILRNWIYEESDR